MYIEQIRGFFDIPIDNLYVRPVLVNAVRKLRPNQVVMPDIGSIKLACAFAEKLNIGFLIINEQYVNANELESALIRDVYQKHVLLVDDICSTREL